MQDFITLPQAAEMLGVTQAAVKQALERDAIIGGKIGGRYYLLKPSVEAYKPREYPRDGEKQEGQTEAQQEPSER